MEWDEELRRLRERLQERERLLLVLSESARELAMQARSIPHLEAWAKDVLELTEKSR